MRITPIATILLISGQLFLGQTVNKDRIGAQIQRSNRVVVKGNIHSLARPEFDRGKVGSSFPMERITLMFKPTAAQQADLTVLLKEQQDPSSSNYQHWLSPEEYADRFGLSQADIQKVETWLRSEGFTIADTARSRQSISFSGTAAQVEASFGTEVHSFTVDNQTYYANVSEPSVPVALRDVVLGFRNLNSFRPKPRARSRTVKPDFTSGVTGNHFLSPDDFATVYDLKPLYAAGIDGTGQKIAIVGQTNILASDILAFRAASGLSASTPQVILVPGSRNPGINTDDLSEADLDLEWSGAVAKNASLIYVNSYNGVFDSFQYAIDQNLAPVLSTSYGDCEANWSSSDRDGLLAITQQANAQGMTVISAAGDSGAADCDYNVAVASMGLAIDLPAGLPSVTGIGGTSFIDPTTGSTYWAATNNSVNGSVLSYIPETSWNDTVAAATLEAGGGGRSIYYSKPAWQVAAGVPNDNARDVPDVSFNASPELDGYLACTNGSCVTGYRAKDNSLYVVGGTSAGAPVFAGVTALINQKMNRSQGNVNSELYRLATTVPSAFHDATGGGNQVACTAGTPDCVGGMLGYSATPGYDLATGLGSIDVFKLITAWQVGNPFLGGGGSTETTIAPYASPDSGAFSTVTNDSSTTLTVGYASIQSSAGTANPAGIAIFGYRSNGVLVTEAGVPAAPALMGARVYAEVAGAVDTGIAIANPGSQAATVSFYFTDSSGANFGSGSTVIPAAGQIAKFLDQAPFNIGRTGFTGTFTISSSQPVSVIALRGRTNERSDFLITTLPVLDTSAAPASATQVLPHFADGGGWTTQVCLVNSGNSAMSGNVQFVSSAGQTVNTVPFTIAANSSTRVATAGVASTTQTGSVLIIPSAGSNAPLPLAVFSYVPLSGISKGITVTEAGVPSVSGSALRVYVESSGTLGAIGSIQSGLAIANSSSSSVQVNFDLRGLDGSELATSSLTIPANQQISKFLTEIFGSLPALKGVLRITTSGPGVSVVGLRGRYNERNDFLITTTPAINEAAPPISGLLLFPHFAMGGGYTTQFILFGGAVGQAPSGYLIFTNQDGTPLNISLQ